MNNQFCLSLNLPDIRDEIPYEYFDELIALQSRESDQAFISFTNKIIPKTALDLLATLGLTACTWKTNLFTSFTFAKQDIHLDGSPEYTKKFRPFAFNWVWGGKTLMEWYAYKNAVLPESMEWSEFKYILFNESECQKIHKQVLTGANLVNITHPHRVINASKERRYCFSICPNEILNWEEITDLCHKHGLIKL